MVESFKSKKSVAESVPNEDSEDRDDPFDSDVTSEEDEDDLMPERDLSYEPAINVDRVIQQELAHQEAEADRLIREELELSGGKEAAELMPSRQGNASDNDTIDIADDQNVAAYQMYQELLDIVRNADQADDSTSTDTTNASRYYSNMPIVAEESETDLPSFAMKKKGADRKQKVRESAFDEIIDQVLEENKNAKRRDDFSDDDDDVLAPDRNVANPLKDFTFVGGAMPMAP